MSDHAQKEFDKAGRAVKQLQDMVTDNPDGFTAEQKAEYDTLKEAALFHNERGMTMKQTAHLAAEGDKEAKILQDIEGMKVTGEIEQSDAPGFLDALHGDGTEISLELSQAALYKNLIKQNAPAPMVAQALSSSTLTAGGNTIQTTVAPDFYEELFNINGIRRAGATVLTTGGGAPLNLPKAGDASLGTFTRNTTNVSTLQTAESAAATERDPTTSIVQLAPQKYLVYTRVPRELVEDSSVDIEGMVARQLGRTVGRTIEIAYAQGRGTNDEPDGWNRTTVVNNVAYSGTGNARRITTAAAGAVAFADIVDTVYAVDDFASSGDNTWLMHKGTVGEIFGVTATDGHPIFKYAPYYGGADNMNDGIGLLFGYPVKLAKYCGQVTTSNDIIAMFGPASEYYIRDVSSVEIRRWDQARYLNDEVDFTARIRTDGKFVNADHFSWLRVQ